jgi:hypothetical protein
MKKQIQIIQNLSLDKETIANLDENQLRDIAGGGSFSCNGAAAALEDSDEALDVSIHSCCDHSCNKTTAA